MMRKLVLLVGAGDVAQAAIGALAAQREMDVVIFSISSEIQTFPFVDISKPDVLVSVVKNTGASRLCAIGAVDFNSDTRMNIATFLQKRVGGALDLSDIGLELAYRHIAQAADVELVGVHELVPSLLAGEGALAGPAISVPESLMARLIDTARTVAGTDLGQSVIFSDARPLAAEDALGTDNLLLRTVEIVRQYGQEGGRLSLVKVARPRQSGIGDLPTIGPKTLENCARASVSLILVEADKCLIAQRNVFETCAGELGIGVFGWR